jgi:Cu/Ag efflux protein CusF
MKNHRLPLGVLGLALVVVSISAAAAAEKPLEGTITSAADGKLSVRADGDQYHFVIADDAKITLDGKDCKLADLKSGHKVKVTWEKKGDQQLATKIEAKSLTLQLALRGDEATYEGTVVSAANSSLAVKVDNLQHNFVVDSSSRIMLDGKEATLSDLKAGHRVKVVSIQEEKRLLARTVTARSKD